MQISVERDDPNKSCAVFLLTSNEVLLNSCCLPNKLLVKSTSLPENISDVSPFWRLSITCYTTAKQIKFHRCSFLNMQIHGTQNKFCRFCSLITQISFFVIPKVCLSKCVFRFLNVNLECLFRRFTLECGLIFLNTGWKSCENCLKESSKEV